MDKDASPAAAVPDQAQAPTTKNRQRLSRDPIWKAVVKRPEAGALAGAILVFIFFYIVAPPFRSVPALTTVIYQTAVLGIPAVGVALLMIGGEFDLSAGVAVTTSSLAASMFAVQLVGNIWFGVAFALVLSLAIGALNGWLLIKTKLHSFLVTLGTFLMLQGLNIALTKVITGDVATRDISSMPGFASAHAVFASHIPFGDFGISIVVVYWLILTLLATWILLRTRIGNWIFAVGGDRDAARAVGVPVSAMKIGLFKIGRAHV